ncbi:MAG: hypothetical protein SF029_14895 [bacterium]|nr:hypothetical protein [bacterium]
MPPRKPNIVDSSVSAFGSGGEDSGEGDLARLNPHLAAKLAEAQERKQRQAETQIVEKVVEIEKLVEVPVALELMEDNIVRAGNVYFTPTGMHIEGTISENEWRALATTIIRIDSARQWILGDWADYGDYILGKKYEELAELTGYKADTLKQYAYVCRNASIRIDEPVRFAHHQVVVSQFPDDQERWLYAARDNRWSVSQLVDAMNGRDPARPKRPTLLSKFQRDLEREQTRLLSYEKKFSRMGQGERQHAESLVDAQIEALQRLKTMLRGKS